MKLLSCCACLIVLFSGCTTPENHSSHHKRISLNNATTPFAAYDSAVISAIERQWYQILDGFIPRVHKYGTVVISFRLHPDGRVSDLKEVENPLGEPFGVICRSAIVDSAPFPEWPSDMHRLVGSEFRDVRFSFNYD